MAFLDEIAAYLEDQGVGTVGTDIFKSRVPDVPDAVTALIETAGLAPDMNIGSTGVRHERAGLQVINRGGPDDYATVRAKAQSAYDAIAAIKSPDQLSGTTYHVVLPQQSAPIPYQVDDKERRWLSSNFIIQKEPS